MGSITPVSSPSSEDSLSDSAVQNHDTIIPPTNRPALDDYIALGCLVVDLSSSGLLSPPIRAQSGTPPNHLSPFDFSLRNAVTTLLDAKWIRVFSRPVSNQERCVLRVYVLPQDVGRSRISLGRNARELQAAFEQLLMHIDVSPSLWDGNAEEATSQSFDLAATPEDNSLFYIFNTLPSPAPSPATIKDRYSRLAAQELLEGYDSMNGLKTPLYPYQARSAAMMVQRETAPELTLDPRLELRQSPLGESFYYGPRDGAFLQHPRLYESVRGGILSETMGLGKTVICLAVILATKGHLPKIPGHCAEPAAIRSGVASLSQMAIATANRHSIPTRAYLDRLCQGKAESLTTCLEQFSSCTPSYRITINPVRIQRRTVLPPPMELILCSGTIIVVPRNLVHQWELEIRKHVCGGPSGLRTLVLSNANQRLPPPEELRQYDVVLFSRRRFEREITDGQDRLGRRVAGAVAVACRCPYIGASRKRDCTCLRYDDIYRSPLKQLHWLRLIIDEGHAFSSKAANAVQVADQLVRAERRWIVSGTPARHRLFGVEVETGSDGSQRATEEHAKLGLDNSEMDAEYMALAPCTDTTDQDQAFLARRMILRRRKDYHKEEEMRGAAHSLGQLATHFLKVRPWAASEFDTGKIDWDEHIFRHESRSKTYSSFSLSLRRTLEALVIKTQPADVERDIVLPPLRHQTVYLEPSFYDKLTINLFIVVLTGNAVTSERTDQDYLFHDKSVKARNSLIANLRQSAFFWTGFTKKMVADAVETGEKYLSKDDARCSAADRQALIRCLEFARLVLCCAGWQALSRTHELGLFCTGWPDESASSWTLADHGDHQMLGVTHAIEAQSHVNSQLLLPDPFGGLPDLGTVVLAQAIAIEDREAMKQSKEPVSGSGVKTTMSTVTLETETSVAKRHYHTSPTKASPTKKSRRPDDRQDATRNPKEQTTAQKRKRWVSDADRHEVPVGSPVRLPNLTGTTSAKLSYLIDQVVIHQHDEKLLIFYDGDDIAYYLAQYLDLLHITYLIYAKSLNSQQKAKYIVTFDENPHIRVLVMDIRCGAEGLNVNKASRVYFINPCCRPNIEAQAIKRSHRIGQTKPVHVETLVLRGTVEEAMFKRARLMTESEHHQAKELADDKQFADIIQNARSIPMNAEDFEGGDKMAPLAIPQQIFGRDGRGKSKIKGIDLDASADQTEAKPRKKRKSKVRNGHNDDAVHQSPETRAMSTCPPAVARLDVPVDTADRQPDPVPTSSLFGGS